MGACTSKQGSVNVTPADFGGPKKLRNTAGTVFKILVLGDSGVGKTCLLSRYVEQKFTHSFKSTVGCDFTTKDVSVDGNLVTLQLWDTAGQERFSSLGSLFYRGADAVALVYDVTERTSLHSLQQWKNEFAMVNSDVNSTGYPIIVLQNKSDVDDKLITLDDAQQWCDENQLAPTPIFVVSALDGTGVTEAFESLATLCVRYRTG